MPGKIDCFTALDPKIGRELKERFDKSYTPDMTELQQRELGKTIVKDYHEQLHNEMNGLRAANKLPVKKYQPEDFSEQHAKITDQYAEQIRQSKADNPEPPFSTGEGTNTTTSNEPEGTRISKQGVFDQYGEQFQKTRIGWNDLTKDSLKTLEESADKKGISIDQEADFEVKTMLNELKDNKLAVSEHRIIAATLNLMNIDRHLDTLKSQTPDTTAGRLALAAEVEAAMDEQRSTLRLIDALGSKSGRNLGLFAGIFSKNDDGGVTAYRKLISGVMGHDLPETVAELDANEHLSNSVKDKIRPYVEKLENIKAEYEALKNKPATNTGASKSKKASDKIRQAANKIRNSKELDKWGLGNPIAGHAQGFTLNVKELVADAMDFIADGVDKGIELAKLIKEAAEKFRGENKHEEFEALLNHIMEQEKPLEEKEGRITDVVGDAAEERRVWMQKKVQGELDALKQHAADESKGKLALAQDWRRAFIIGGIKTVGRVGVSGVSKFIIDPISRFTIGKIPSLLPGLENRSTNLKAIGEGVSSLIKFKNDAEANRYVNEKMIAFDKVSKELEKDPDNPSLQEDYMKAELDYAQSTVYRFIHGNAFQDAKDLFMTGSTDFEQAMGGYSKTDYKMLRGAGQKAMYFVSAMARLHGVEKNPSARRALVEEYNNKLEEYQKKGMSLSASTRMRALDMAYAEYLSGKYQDKTELSSVTNEAKYAGDKPGATLTKKILSNFVKYAVPVAKVPINIAKAGVDMSTVGIEGVLRYAHEINKGRKFNEAQGKEYDSIWDSLKDAANDIPEKDKAYIHKTLTRGLFGAGLMAFAAWGVKNGTIRYGGSYHEGKDKVKYKSKDGEWHDDLDYGQWVINGHKFGKFASSVINHLPEFLPIAMVVNTHNVYEYEHKYEGAEENRQVKSPATSFWEAMKSDLGEVGHRLPYSNLLEPGNAINSLVTLPLAKDIGEYFDTDKDGHKIERKPANFGQKLAQGVGLEMLVDKKKDEDDK